MYLKSYTVYVSIYNGATTELVDCCKRNVEIDSFINVRPILVSLCVGGMH